MHARSHRLLKFGIFLSAIVAISVAWIATAIVSGSAKAVRLAPAAASSVQLNAASYSVSESDGFVQINVARSGDTSGAATVDYATLDGAAGQRSKYEIASGTIKFAAGETTKILTVLINDNTYLDGNQ